MIIPETVQFDETGRQLATRDHKSFGRPDETREFPNGKAEILSVGGSEVGRMTFEPGWRWSNDVSRSLEPR